MTWTPPDEQLLCNMCFPNHVELGYVAPGLILVLAPDGKYVIFVSPAHRGDEWVTLPERPEPDPIPDELWDDEAKLEELGEEIWSASNDWVERAYKAFENVSFSYLRSTWHLVNDLIEAGYNPKEDGEAELWLYARCAEVVAEFEAR